MVGMESQRCLGCCIKGLFASTLILAIACVGNVSVLLFARSEYQLSRCGQENVNCSSWVESVYPHHLVLMQSLMPAVMGAGVVAIATVISLRSSQEKRALTLHIVALPFVLLAVGLVSRALATFSNNKRNLDIYMSHQHLVYCGLLYSTLIMQVVSIVIIVLKRRPHRRRSGKFQSASLRRASSCEVIRTTDPSNARSPVVTRKSKHQPATTTSIPGTTTSSAPASVASTRPASRVALLSNQSGMATRVPAASMESVLYNVRESNDEYTRPDADRWRGKAVHMAHPLAETQLSGPSGALPEAALLPGDSDEPVVAGNLMKMQKMDRPPLPPRPSTGPGTPSESSW